VGGIRDHSLVVAAPLLFSLWSARCGTWIGGDSGLKRNVIRIICSMGNAQSWQISQVELIYHYALGLISPQERLVANVIRGIRNVFAHTLAQIDFSHELTASKW
jgi:hypothetical protein